MPITTLLCYALEDRGMVRQLKKHLSILERNEHITLWDLWDIIPGAEREQEMKKRLATAQVILLAISADFLDSHYHYKVEIQEAIRRHESKEARVIPVILRHAIWEVPPLHNLQPLPEGGKPVSDWRPREAGFKNIAHGIMEVTKQWNARNLADPIVERRMMIAKFDRLVETVKTQMEPPVRALSTASTLQQLSIFIPNGVTLADLIVGWQTLSSASQQEEDPATSQRRVTCGELAQLASQFTTDQGSLAQAIATWDQWVKAFQYSGDPRQATMARTFAREREELQKANQLLR